MALSLLPETSSCVKGGQSVKLLVLDGHEIYIEMVSIE